MKTIGISNKLSDKDKMRHYTVLMSNLHNVIFACEKLGIDIKEVTVDKVYMNSCKELHKLIVKE